ncbi:hypothetical protein F4780DRAFT_792126 [Xylariomycetidae sp. FL0641]|nr:hypothetical protein F4780DRAFT_792126 [Xylariomycetidae sp. FL0641]
MPRVFEPSNAAIQAKQRQGHHHGSQGRPTRSASYEAPMAPPSTPALGSVVATTKTPESVLTQDTTLPTCDTTPESVLTQDTTPTSNSTTTKTSLPWRSGAKPNTSPFTHSSPLTRSSPFTHPTSFRRAASPASNRGPRFTPATPFMGRRPLATPLHPNHTTSDADATTTASTTSTSTTTKRPWTLAPTSSGFTPTTTGSTMSPNYRGNPLLAGNQSAAIPHAENTSLWVTGLPARTTYHGLLGALAGRGGKVFATVINGAGDGHATAAAKLTFFRHADAARVLAGLNAGALRVDGGDEEETNTVLARWNRVRTREFPVPATGTRRPPSRVVHVRGPPRFVNPGCLGRFFGDRFFYQLDCIVSHGVLRRRSDDDTSTTSTTDAATGGQQLHAEYEYRFASWKCQAEFASMALRRERPDVRVWYGRDPCEVVGEVGKMQRGEGGAAVGAELQGEEEEDGDEESEEGGEEDEEEEEEDDDEV